MTTTTLPAANGYVELRSYDRDGRLTTVTNQKGTTLLSKFVSTLDPVGNPTGIDRTGKLAEITTYTFDPNDRVVTACFAATCTATSNSRIAWTYDRVGNRLTETRGKTTVTSTYNTADQLTAAGSTAYTYDANGNQTKAGARTFTWDLTDHMKTTTSGPTTTTYTYDGDGVRQQASTGTAASAKTNFLWDVNQPDAQLAIERDGTSALLRQYVYGIRLIRQTVGTPSYYLYNALGSVVNTLSATGATQRTWSYEPYGVVKTSSGSSPANPFLFAGEYQDPTGLYNLRARQYDPASGRFLSADPVENQGSAYAFAGARPTVMTDPSGMTFAPPSAGLDAVGFAMSPASSWSDARELSKPAKRVKPNKEDGFCPAGVSPRHVVKEFRRRNFLVGKPGGTTKVTLYCGDQTYGVRHIESPTARPSGPHLGGRVTGRDLIAMELVLREGVPTTSGAKSTKKGSASNIEYVTRVAVNLCVGVEGVAGSCTVEVFKFEMGVVVDPFHASIVTAYRDGNKFHGVEPDKLQLPWG